MKNNNLDTRKEKFYRVLEEKNVQMISEDYIKASFKYDFKCKICGTIFNKNASLLTSQDYPCPKCSKIAKYNRHLNKVKDIFNSRMEKSKLNEHYEVVEYPELIRDNAKFRHKECGNIIETSIGNLSRKGVGCKYCSKTHTYTKEEVKEYISNNRFNYALLDIFMSSDSHLMIKVKHNICNNVFIYQFNYFMRGNGCRECHTSGGEEIIIGTLDNEGIVYDVEKSFNDMYYLKNLKFDFYIPNLNIAIEYDGIQHTKPPEHWGNLDVRIARDNAKNEYCSKKGITLIRIPHNIRGKKLIETIKGILKLDSYYINKYKV